MRYVTVAATQFACNWDLLANAETAEALVRQAAAAGAQVVLIQELFAAPYFCIEQHPCYFDLALPAEGHPLITRFAALARQVVAKAGRDAEEVLLHRFDLDAIAALRAGWGLFRDRRVDLYGTVGTLDGRG